jgi:uracil-DNA glycosylase family 4
MKKVKCGISRRSQWKRYQKRWKECEACPLHENRNNVVLAGGTLPFDICFIGEAPGLAEDHIGYPFIGPSGKLLQEMISDAIEESDIGYIPDMAFTNTVCCRPVKDNQNVPPKKSEMKACTPRLASFLRRFSKEQFYIVLVGQVAATYAKNFLPSIDLTARATRGEIIQILHPSAILRTEGVRQNLQYKKNMLKISELLRTYLK